jgi:hypothetical protein
MTPAGTEGVDTPEGDDTALSRFVGLRNGISRRMFLGRGSVVAGVAAAVATVPGLGSLLTSGEADAPEVGGAAEAGSGAAADMTEPVVAHVVNATTGEINLYQGEQMIAARSPALAQALARLAAKQ